MSALLDLYNNNSDVEILDIFYPEDMWDLIEGGAIQASSLYFNI